MRCPECHTTMQNGFIPTGGGMFWFRKDQPLGSVEFATDVPGTFTWMRRAKLEAYRCPRCSLITFRYGKQVQTPESFEHR
ncbi:MAG: PF20097 family protein [Phycisphaeraceae bacterium]